MLTAVAYTGHGVAPRLTPAGFRQVTFLIRAAAVALVTVGLAACGGSGDAPAVVRVAGVAISKGTVEHWASAIQRGAVPATLVSSRDESPRRRAIAFLISADWLVGEAAERGFKLSENAIRRRVQEEGNSAAGGRTEFRQTLAAVGETVADAELEEHARWAASVVHGLLAAKAAGMTRGAVTERAVTAYYNGHLARYLHKEVRAFSIDESLKSMAAGWAFVRRIGLHPSRDKFLNYKSYERPSRFAQGRGGRGLLLRAIFSARIGAVSRPMRLFQDYAVFMLRKITPSVVDPLSAVRGLIEEQLRAGPRRQALAKLIAAYDRKWTARTDCDPGYVAQNCKQYQGPLVSEDEALPANGARS